MDRKPTRRRAGAWLAAAASLLASLTIGVAPVAASNGEVAMTISVFPTQAAYGEVLTLEATTRDDSDSCFGTTTTPGSSCDFPHGRIDFYAAEGTTQTFLASADLVLDLDVPINFWQTTTDPVEFCCLEVGSYDHIRAYYVPGDFDAESVDSDPITIARNGSTVTLDGSPTTAAVGQAITFDVHVAGFATHPNAAKVTGAIDVFEGPTSYGTVFLDASGDASLTTSQLPLGRHFLRARWIGDDHYTGNSSAPLEVVVGGGTTTTTLGASATSTTYGAPVTFTATVAAANPPVGTPTGGVGFRDGLTLLGTGSLNESSPNVATLTTSELAVGNHSVQATYAGDGVYLTSPSNTITVSVSKAATTTSLQSSANPSTFGSPVTITATVNGPGPTTVPGMVQFSDGGLPIGSPVSLALGQASLTIATLGGGSHSITASYAGSANYLPSTSQAMAQMISCDKLLTGSVASVTALPGESTCLSGAKVTGSISVAAGASLSIVNSTVSGNIVALAPAATASATLASVGPAAAPVGAGSITICASTISGGLSVSGPRGFVLVGDRLEDACAGNTIKGSVSISGTTGGLAVADNRISGGVTIANNTGPGPAGHSAPEVEANQIGGFLWAYGNTPVATDDGRRNTVKGWTVFG